MLWLLAVKLCCSCHEIRHWSICAVALIHCRLATAVLQAVQRCRQCGIEGGERVPPAPLGWYLHFQVSRNLHFQVRRAHHCHYCVQIVTWKGLCQHKTLIVFDRRGRFFIWLFWNGGGGFYQSVSMVLCPPHAPPRWSNWPNQWLFLYSQIMADWDCSQSKIGCQT